MTAFELKLEFNADTCAVIPRARTDTSKSVMTWVDHDHDVLWSCVSHPLTFKLNVQWIHVVCYQLPSSPCVPAHYSTHSWVRVSSILNSKQMLIVYKDLHLVTSTWRSSMLITAKPLIIWALQHSSPTNRAPTVQTMGYWISRPREPRNFLIKY